MLKQSRTHTTHVNTHFNFWKLVFAIAVISLPLIAVYPILVSHSNFFLISQNMIHAAMSVVLLILAYDSRDDLHFSIEWVMGLVNCVAFGLLVTIGVEGYCIVIHAGNELGHILHTPWQFLVSEETTSMAPTMVFIPTLLLMAFLTGFSQLLTRKQIEDPAKI